MIIGMSVFWTKENGERKQMIIDVDTPEEGFQIVVDAFAETLFFGDPIGWEEIYICDYKDADHFQQQKPETYWTPEGWSPQPFDWFASALEQARAKEGGRAR